jgi:hypothetical protein
VQIESTILCAVCQYTQYYAGRGPGLHRGGVGRMPMGGRAAEVGGMGRGAMPGGGLDCWGPRGFWPGGC